MGIERRINMPGKKKPKGTRNAGVAAEKRELLFREEDQQYGRVIAMLGNRRINIDCLDGVKRMGIIRGSMKRGAINRVRQGDFVLCSLRDYQDDKCDVVHKYDMDEIRRLKGYGEIDASVKLQEESFGGDADLNLEDDGIDFDFSDGDVDDI